MTKKPHTRVNHLANLLCGRIVRSGLEPGDVLGTERNLAVEFGVSYGMMRESVGRLRALGILSGKQRTGLVVQKPGLGELFERLIPFTILEDEDVIHLMEFRLTIELGAVVWAVGRADEKILDKMEQTIEPFERLQAEGRISETDPYDIKFHTLLLEASGNKLLASFHDVVARYFTKSVHKYPQINFESELDRSKDHRRLLDAIRAGDRARAVDVLCRHLQFNFPEPDGPNSEDNHEQT